MTTKQTKERKNNRAGARVIMINIAGDDFKLFKTTKCFEDMDLPFHCVLARMC